jgi:hypothetical protein
MSPLRSEFCEFEVEASLLSDDWSGLSLVGWMKKEAL